MQLMVREPGKDDNMGSIGASKIVAISATKYNEQGFEVEDSKNPEIEFTDRVWKEMAELRKYFDAFQDYDLQKDVRDKMYEIGEDSRYEDAMDLYNRIENGDNVTEDEYWAGYHVLAGYLNIRPQRYTVWDSGMSAWDDRFTSVEQAEHWAAEREGAKYVYDRWTRKYRKIGGKNWRN